MIISQERRKNKRIILQETGFVTGLNSKYEKIAVKIMDVSNNGVGIITDRIFPTKGEFILTYSVFSRNFNIPVQIAWTDSAPLDCHMGCRKINPS